MKEDKTTVYFDGIIFSRNPTGGIARVFCNIILRMLKREDVCPKVYLPEGTHLGWLPRENTVFYKDPPALRPARVFKPLNMKIAETAVHRRWGALKGGVFISTFYTTHPSLRVPQILFVHDLIFEKYPKFFKESLQKKHVMEKKESIGEATAILCCSRSTENDLQELFATEGKTLRVIPYGIEDKFSPERDKVKVTDVKERFTGGQDFIIHVGARKPLHKNFRGLLKAYSLWGGKEKMHILSVGGGDLSEEERRIISELNITDKVHCVQKVSDKDLVLAYNAASACSVPSFCEGFGFPLLEAMACGIPVLASDKTSLPEIGGDIPEYFNPEDTESLLRALENLGSIENDAERLQRGIERAKNYKWESSVDSYVELIKEMTKSKRS